MIADPDCTNAMPMDDDRSVLRALSRLIRTAGFSVLAFDRPTALRFSFYLAIPTLLAASGFDFVRSLDTLTASAMPSFAVGAVTSFLVATWSFALLSLRAHRALLICNAIAAAATIGGVLLLEPLLHARGAAISTLIPGNPGPQQLPIPYDDPPYSNTVVPFRAILQ